MEAIDADALWKLEGEYLVLVDEDQHISVFYESHENWFYEVEKPEAL